jgi:hypothetical protein
MIATDPTVTEITATQLIALGPPWADDHTACEMAMAAVRLSAAEQGEAGVIAAGSRPEGKDRHA